LSDSSTHGHLPLPFPAMFASAQQKGQRLVEPSSTRPIEQRAKLDVLADPIRMRDILQQHLRLRSSKPCEVLSCAIGDQRRRDESRRTAECELRIRDPESGLTWDEIVNVLSYGEERTRRVWENMRSIATPTDGAAEHPLLEPFAYVPELNLILKVFPHDHRLPALALLLAGPIAELEPDLLSDFGEGDWVLVSWNAETVQYRVDMRAIVRLDVTASDQRSGRQEIRRFYAKVYYAKEQAQQAYLGQSRLYDRLDAEHEWLTLAKPVACSSRLRTVISRAVPGTSLAKLIRQGGNTEPWLRMAAQAIAWIHLLDVEAPPRPIEQEIARLRDAAEALCSRRPDLEPTITAIVETVVAGLNDVPTSLTHGDLKPEHFLIDAERVAVIDFDLMTASDPMLDVARMTAFLSNSRERPRRDRGSGASASQVFLEEYFRHVPESWRARLPLYHAMASVHKAASVSWRPGRDHRDPTEDFLLEGQALLEGGAADGLAPSFKRRAYRRQLESR
jgi:hypothetical protein